MKTIALKIIIYLLLFSLFSSAQTEKIVSGIVTEQVISKDGTLKIIRTSNFPAGKTISGTVLVETESEKPGKKTKQLENLDKYVIKLGNNIISPNGMFQMKLPETGNIPLQIFNSKGDLVQETVIDINTPLPNTDFNIPKTIRRNNVEKITGDFCGDISKANLKINEQPVKIMAGNESELFFQVEDVEPGIQNLTLEYEEVSAEEQINLVDYTLQVGNLNMNKGEQTFLDVEIIGLTELKEPLSFSISNQSVGTVALSGGDNQQFIINPEEVAEKGEWQKHFDINSLVTGRFSISTDLEIINEPEDPVLTENIIEVKSTGTKQGNIVVIGEMAKIIPKKPKKSPKKKVLKNNDSVDFVPNTQDTAVAEENQEIRISGFVKNRSTLEPIFDATVFLLNSKTNEVLILKTDTVGHFGTSVDKDNLYIIKAMKNKFLEDCTSIRTPEIITEEIFYPRDLLLGIIKINQVFKVENIYYDLDKSFIREDAIPALDNLVRILKQYPINVELSSHTDCRASDEYNFDLSQRRAEAAVRYIILKGIAPSRIIAKGYGESKLVNRCADGVICTEEEHQENRRTEFKITAINYELVVGKNFDASAYKAGDKFNASLLPSDFFDGCIDF